MYSPGISSTKHLSSKRLLINQQSDLIKNLKQQVKNANFQNFYRNTSLNLPEHSSPSKKTYAQELLKQIGEKTQKQGQNKHSKILENQSEQNLCSLNIPRTSSQQRQRLEKELRKKVSQELKAQITEKISRVKSENSQNLQNERKEVELLMKRLQDEEREKMEQSRIELEYLTRSWRQQVQYKELKAQVSKMEINGLAPRPKGKMESVSPVPLKIESGFEGFKDKTKSLTPVIGVKKQQKVGYKERARVIKTQMDRKFKESPLYQLKKSLEHVKSTRRFPIKSLSPSINASYKRLN